MSLVRIGVKNTATRKVLRRLSPRCCLENVAKLELVVRLDADKRVNRTVTVTVCADHLQELATTLELNRIATVREAVFIVVGDQMISIMMNRHVEIVIWELHNSLRFTNLYNYYTDSKTECNLFCELKFQRNQSLTILIKSMTYAAYKSVEFLLHSFNQLVPGSADSVPK